MWPSSAPQAGHGLFTDSLYHRRRGISAPLPGNSSAAGARRSSVPAKPARERAHDVGALCPAPGAARTPQQHRGLTPLPLTHTQSSALIPGGPRSPRKVPEKHEALPGQPVSSWASPPCCSGFAEPELANGTRERGFRQCKSACERGDASCCQECAVSGFLGHYPTAGSSSERRSCNSIRAGGRRTPNIRLSSQSSF